MQQQLIHPTDLKAIKRALEALPSQCRYHGEKTEPVRELLQREACCDTGTPAQRRKLAEEAVRRLEAQ